MSSLCWDCMSRLNGPIYDFFSNLYENAHIYVHYSGDEEYYVKHWFSPPGGACTCLFFAFRPLFRTLFTSTFISDPYDDKIMIKKIDRTHALSEPNCVQICTKMVQKWYIWSKMKLILHLLYHSMYVSQDLWITLIMYNLVHIYIPKNVYGHQKLHNH